MRFYQLLLLTGLVALVIMGLNTSNQGINNLTRQERQAVFDVDYSSDKLKVEALGNSHEYTWDMPRIKQQSQTLMYECIDYLKRIWNIFDAVFLYE